MDLIKTADTVPAFFAPEEYREEHAGQQQDGKDQYNKVFFFHSVLLSKIRYKKPTEDIFLKIFSFVAMASQWTEKNLL